MNYLTERKYSFTSSALPGDSFAVVSFTGEEGLSKPYRLEIGLVTGETGIDLDAVMAGAAKFVIHREDGGDVPFSGILTAFEQQHAVDGYIFYRATLVPRLWWLSLTRHNQVFLDKTVQEMVEAVLKDGGLTALDYEFKLQGVYEPQQYVCQYGESHLDFIDRWLAREGIYYYFEQTEHGEKIVFTDTAIAHGESAHGWDLTFSPPSGLGALHAAESVQGFVCRQHLLPGRVLLKDYNYRKPGLEMTGRAEVDPNGRGERFIYGEHFKTPEEGNRLAKIRAQDLLCRKREFIGESTVPYVTPGFTFTLQQHYQSDFNQKYLTLEMTHAGNQTGYLVTGIHKGLSDRERTVAYRNQFTAIPAGVQFRAPKTSDAPKITGTLNARIDAEGSGQYAELDDHGRYKVLLPFDVSGRKDGKGSAWLRMAQPYAGTDHGMHFPLHKGTEVLLTFIDGNPDRPIIAAAVPNPDTPTVISRSNATNAGFKTAGGNQISMQDDEGHERISLNAGDGKSRIILGSGSGNFLSSQSNVQIQSADYIHLTLGGVGGAVANSFAWSAMSGSLLPQAAIKLSKYFGDQISKADELGYRPGYNDGTKVDVGKDQAMIFALAATIPSVLFGNWIAYSLAKQLERKGLVKKERDFGAVSQEFTETWKDNTHWGRLKWIAERMGYIGAIGKTLGLGSTGTYGVSLFSHMPEEYFGKLYEGGKGGIKDWARWLLDPRCASMIQVNKALPDVLVAASLGHVDVIGKKGVNLFSSETINVEAGKEAALHAKNSAYLTAGEEKSRGIVAINHNFSGSVELETGSSYIRLQEHLIYQRTTEAIRFFLQKDYEHATYKDLIKAQAFKDPYENYGEISIIGTNRDKSESKILLENETCIIELDSQSGKEQVRIEISARGKKKDKPPARIKLNLSEKSIEINAEELVDVNAKTINIGTEADSINIGKKQTNLSLLGSKATIDGDKIKIG